MNRENKMKEWTPPDGRNQFIDSFVNRARTYYDNFASSISHDTRSNLTTNQRLITPVAFLRKATGVVESFGRLIIFYIGLKCHFNYFVL